MEKILIYTDCFIYSGSENVIENIYESKDIRDSYMISIYYANNKEYEKGIRRKFGNDNDIKSISIISPFSKWGYYLQYRTKLGIIKYFYYYIFYALGRLLHLLGFIDIINGCVLFNYFRKEKSTRLFINNGGYPGAQSCRVAVISARMAGIKNIILCVNNMAKPSKNIFDREYDKYINKSVSCFLTASGRAKQQLIVARKFDSIKCINIPNTLSVEKENYAKTINGVLRKEFSIDEKTILLGSAGLLTYRKGFHILVDSIKYLKDRCGLLNKCKLVILGDGEERDRLERQIIFNGLEEVILLPGYRNNILDYMKDFDIFILPSVANEDFPYVIIEAMLLEKPIIGTDIAGIPEQVKDGYNGFVVDPNNSLALSYAIERLVTSKELIKLMGRNSYLRYMDNFSNAKIVKRYLSLFNSL